MQLMNQKEVSGSVAVQNDTSLKICCNL